MTLITIKKTLTLENAIESIIEAHTCSVNSFMSGEGKCLLEPCVKAIADMVEANFTLDD